MRLVMVTRWAKGEPEAEPIMVEVVQGRAQFTLDDGERLAFDVNELRAAIETESLADNYGEAA